MMLWPLRLDFIDQSALMVVADLFGCFQKLDKSSA